MRRQPTEAQYARSEPVWLVTITWAGRVFRFSTEPVTITTAAGEQLWYPGGLDEPDLEEQLSTFGADVADLSVPVEVVFDVDVAERNASGKPLSAARGAIDMVLVDEDGSPLETWEERYPILDGLLNRPIYAHPERPAGWARFSIESRPFDDVTTIIPSTARINGGTHPGYLAEVLGKVCPIVFGVGVGYNSETGAAYKGSPAYRVGSPTGASRTLLISLGRVTAEQVTLIDNSGNDGVVDVQMGVDGLGQLYSYVVASAADGFSINDEEWWVCWHDGTTTVGGISRLDDTGPITGAGDLLIWLFARSSLDVDMAAWVSVRDLLNQYKFAGYIQDPDATVWTWAREKVLSLLQLAVAARPAGLTPIVFDFEQPDTRLAADIEVGRDWHRVAPLTPRWNRRDIVNSVTVEYMLYPQRGSYGGLIRCGSAFAERSIVDSGQTPTHHARESQSQWGVVQERIISSEFIVDRSTAQLVADTTIRRRGFQLDDTTFDAPKRWGRIQVGARVRLTEEGASMTQRLATVTNRRWFEGSWVFDVEISRDPIRDQ